MVESKHEPGLGSQELPKDQFLFASESVGEGHADKLCDQISDAIVDACLRADPDAKVACEVTAKGNKFYVLGELALKGFVDIPEIVKEAVRLAGFDSAAKGLDYNSIQVQSIVQDKSNESTALATLATLDTEEEDIGPASQGVAFGYATDEWDEESLMPLSHFLASRICERLSECRKDHIIPWLRADSKSQVTVQYKREGGRVVPLRIHTILVSTQHDPAISYDIIQKEVMEKVIRHVVPSKFLDENTIVYINPYQPFIVGGPLCDAGLSGRKIIVDTYGGWATHGGGSFSGKDPSKIERAGAYYARYVAKNLVRHQLCHRVLLRVSYGMGASEPISVYLDSYGTVKEGLTDNDLRDIVKKNFDFRPPHVIEELQLKLPIYQRTAAFGHFGRSGPEFPWETCRDHLLV